MVSEKLEAALRGKKSKKKKSDIVEVGGNDPLFLPASLMETPGSAVPPRGLDVNPKPAKKKEKKKKPSALHGFGGSSNKVQSGTAPVVKKVNKLRSTPMATAPTPVTKKPSK